MVISFANRAFPVPLSEIRPSNHFLSRAACFANGSDPLFRLPTRVRASQRARNSRVSTAFPLLCTSAILIWYCHEFCTEFPSNSEDQLSKKVALRNGEKSEGAKWRSGRGSYANCIGPESRRGGREASWYRTVVIGVHD